jgi:hypothetical protein
MCGAVLTRYLPFCNLLQVDLVTVSSPHHIELNPSDYGIRDRLVVQEIIKEIAQSRPLDTISGLANRQQQTDSQVCSSARTLSLFFRLTSNYRLAVCAWIVQGRRDQRCRRIVP